MYRQVRSEGIKVTTVCPASVNTGLFEKGFVGSTAPGEDRDIGELVALLRRGSLSPQRYFIGQC